jgi:hypothetical protein
VPGDINANTVLSGDLYVTEDVYINEGTVLTLTAGTTVTMCGEYDFKVDRFAGLVMAGEAESPVVVDVETGVTKWGHIYLGWNTALTSSLHHVILNNGGGTDLNAGVVNVTPLGHTTDVAGPMIDHVTIRNSAAYGIRVDSYNNDPTPPSLSNLTVTGSYAAPLLLRAADAGGLGTGNTFTGNVTNTIQVFDGDIPYSQTWRLQPVPYEVLDNLNIEGANTPVFTIAAGNTLLMHPDVYIDVGRPGLLVARGTVTMPITFDAVDPTRRWDKINFGWESVPSTVTQATPMSTLQHVVINNAGGNNVLSDRGALEIQTLGNTETAGPVIDHVIIRNSAAYGMLVDSYNNDPTPPLLSNLTVTGSQAAPLLIDAADLGGLGMGNTFTANVTNTIQLMAFSDNLNYTHTWRTQPVPFEVLGSLSVRGGKITIEKGNAFLMYPNVDLNVGSLYGKGALIVAGTRTHPVTFTRALTLPWGSISYEGAHLYADGNRLSYVNVYYGGGLTGERAGAVALTRDSTLQFDHLDVRHSLNAGIYSSGFALHLVDSTVMGNRIGVQFNGSRGVLRRNTIRSNIEAGVINDDPDKICVDAVGNYWGAANGPVDSSGAADACNTAATNAGDGDGVSDGVRYDPWLAAATGSELMDASRITPEDTWMIADGVQTTTLTILARDALGDPMVGKMLEVRTSLGSVQQPSAPTDENGRAMAVISATETGGATITVYNLTDDKPLAALTTIYFWQGGGGTAGLIQPGGAPYVAPQFIVEGRPIEQGSPIVFRVPMRNSNPDPVEVRVVYAVSGLNIGAGFTPVAEVSRTLQPAETWDALATWTPSVSGHHCVQARLTVTTATGVHRQLAPQETVDVGPFQVNLNIVPPDPCNAPDPNKLIPRGGGLSGVRKHMQKALIQTYLVKECLKQELTFRAPQATAQRAYQIVVTPPSYTPPALEPGNGVSQAQADAATQIGDLASDLTALDVAIWVTAQRVRQAGQADDNAAVSEQLTAYQGFMRTYAQKLEALANAIDDLLAATEGAGESNSSYMPEDYDAYLADLRAGGYATDTVTFLQNIGLDSQSILQRQQAEIERLEGMTFYPTTFYDVLRAVRDDVRERAAEIQATHGTAARGPSASSLERFYMGTVSTDFTVANPFTREKTIDLVVRPIEMPINWSAYLDDPAPTLGAGEATTVTLTLEAGSIVPADTRVRIAVEGFVADEYIGGILFERRIPGAEAGVALSAGTSQTVTAGNTLTFTHVVTNMGTTTDTIILEASNTEGWPWALIHSVAHPEGTLTLPLPLGSEMTATIALTLTAPADAVSGTVNTATITATSKLDPTVFVTVTDVMEVWERGFEIYLPLVLKGRP